MDALIEQEMSWLLPTYQHLHSNPELSYLEKETGALLARELRRLGYEVTEYVGDYGVPGRTGYGLVAVLRNGAGPTVMVRTDTDALPVEERTGLPYASQARAEFEGAEYPVMHACGHDIHMTSFLGTAALLAQLKDKWSGTLVLIAQPAEERGAGALAMLRDGLYQRFPRPDFALALHSNANMAAGTVGARAGYVLANVDSVDITVRGYGGHGSTPEATKDPIVVAAQVVLALQTIVSREVSPFDPAVVTVGSIHGGTKHNIIPDEVHLQITVRSYKPEVRKKVLAAIERITRGVAAAAGIPEERAPVIRISEDEFTPSTYNDPELTGRVTAALQRALGPENVLAVEPVMGGEDFSRYGMEEPRVPISMFWLGTVDPARVEEAREKGQRLPSLHSSAFAPLPEPTLRTGVKAMTSAVLELMKK
ncbi:MAG TPA: amidohydrolase [Candidatus Acidoferrales bacterium]